MQSQLLLFVAWTYLLLHLACSWGGQQDLVTLCHVSDPCMCPDCRDLGQLKLQACFLV